MSVFSHLPLGQRIPDRPHAVSCSLPTMRAVRGYEEKDPAVTQHLTSGYPRFVVHPFARQLAAHFIATTPALAARPELAHPGHTLWLTSSAKMARALAAHLNRAEATAAAPINSDLPSAAPALLTPPTPATPPALAALPTPPPPPAAPATAAAAQLFARDGLHGVAHSASATLAARAKTFLQNHGGFLSSREAEDHLLRLGLLARPEPSRDGAAAPAEETFPGDSAACAAEVRRHLCRALPGTTDADLLLANCGMSAISAAFRATADLQATRGRTLWIQLGWLYLDTIAILQKCTTTPADYVYIRDVFDLTALARLFAAHGPRIAGIIAEVPTNPLIQTPDLPALAALCRHHGARLLVDPSIASVWNLDVLPHADVVVTSLTKYAASSGDLTAGLAAINPHGPDAAALRQRIAAELEPLYPRDLARLAVQIGRADAVLAQIHAGTARVAAFLATHPAVRDVFWARSSTSPASTTNFLRLARSPDATGGIITFTLRAIGALEKFYDRLRLPKGPSFGMTTTLICPFMYLAHYDLVTTPAGLAELAASQLDPDLLRLCVGTEPPEAIIAALAEALG